MPDLNNYLTLADLQPFFDNAKPDDSITEAWRKQYFENLEHIVEPALMSFFKALKGEGRMAVIPNSEGYDSRVWNAWNDVAKLSLETEKPADADKKLALLAEVFAHTMTHEIVWPYERVLKKSGSEAAAAFDKSVAFAEVVQTFNKGTYPQYVFSYETCQATGMKLYLSFQDWVPTGSYRDPKTNGFVPVEPLAQPGLQETVLELKTGNLLVSDWFRIKGFTDATKVTNISLESRKGRQEHAHYFATKFGIVRVCVDNTSPAVFQDGNQLIVGNHYDDDEGEIPARLAKVAQVCTDLWAATFVEYETLIELVGRSLPDTAKEVVDAYLSESLVKQHTYRITVEPGTYYLYHFGDIEDFPEIAEKAGLKLDLGPVEPFFVLSPTRLLKDNPA